MSTRAEKALKAQKDKHHSILREVVQELTNKTCADCLAKGPRWASWNIGVFVCIRCAGIHRNLGVHISKCKSIDLDSWTQEQLEHFLKWGNKRAGQYYECYLPKDFTRPQGNQAVETFIRNKYEKKLYIKKDGEPEAGDNKYLEKLKGNTTEKENKPPSSRRKERGETKSDDKPAEKTILNIAKKAPVVKEVRGTVEEPAKLSVTPSHVKSSSMNDLLTLGHGAPADPSVKASASTDDLLNFGAFSDPVPSSQVDPFQSNSSLQLQENIYNNTNGCENMTVDASKSTKESILSLYSSGNSNQQKMYGVPGGVYMQQQQMPHQMAQQMTQQMPQQMNQQMNQQMPQQMNQHMTKQMSQQMPQQMTKQMSQQMPQQMTKQMSQQMSQQMTQQMAQQMTQQMTQQGNMVYGYPQQQSMPNQMRQMNSQMQQMSLNHPNQMMTTHQSNPYNQGPMNQFGSSGQLAFATPMYTSNSNMMSNQMNSVYQHQKFQPSANIQNNTQPIMTPNNTAGNFGNTTMAQNTNMQGMNTRWNAGGQNMMSQQQQQSGHYNMNSTTNGMRGHTPNGMSGYTMNNQLWN